MKSRKYVPSYNVLHCYGMKIDFEMILNIVWSSFQMSRGVGPKIEQCLPRSEGT